MGAHGMSGPRLLPWAGEGGKPCYLIGDGAGYLSRVADGVESVQLAMTLPDGSGRPV
ncbi:hypothetical protein [Streptomyces sp. L2]|uniref:hypothetical protein n=1 Tax=Streptomyces sp. L2 TaxID=2162665 RepID=UPI0013E97FDC|nr:hypothetical protein [Streptomyces sp. L2]